MVVELDLTLAVTLAVFSSPKRQGLIGKGLPTIAMGLLVVMLPAQAAAILVVPSFVTNLWQLLAGLPPPAWSGGQGHDGWRRRRHHRRLGGPCRRCGGDSHRRPRCGADLFMPSSAYRASALPSRTGMSAGWSPWSAPPDLVTGATVFVISAVPYLQSLGLDKEELIQALGLSFTVSTMALAAGLWRGRVPLGIRYGLRTGADPCPRRNKLPASGSASASITASSGPCSSPDVSPLAPICWSAPSSDLRRHNGADPGWLNEPE
ncbi:MAG: hypothetical protein U1E38_00515 [Rhodospirillales bacterium]